ncbi:MAG: hypothetical protein AAB393_19330, partial [Bacteroidota bacterium]
FSNKFKSGFSLGITVKLFYYHLNTDVSSTTVGIDLGLLVPVGEALTVGASARDINSKYQWETSEIYGQKGNSTKEEFPQLYTVGVAYKLPDSLGVVAVDVETSNKKTLTARFGVEIPLIPEITVRAGMDRIDLKEKGYGVRPTFGFTARKDLETWTPAINYAFVVEPFAPSPMHVVSLSVIF